MSPEEPKKPEKCPQCGAKTEEVDDLLVCTACDWFEP
jgi:hypothetical protein